MAVLSAGIFLMVGTDAETPVYSKLCDITEIPALSSAPNTVDVTSLSDWIHKYIAGLLDTGGNLEFPAFLDNDTLPKIMTTEHYKHVAVWFGGTKSNTGAVTPTGSALKVDWEGDVTMVPNGTTVDSAVGVNVVLTPGSQPVVTRGTLGATLLVPEGTTVSTKEIFVGDGTTTAFTVSNTPATVTAVEVANVAQTSGSDYTVSGKVFTFDTAPGNGEAVEISYSYTA